VVATSAYWRILFSMLLIGPMGLAVVAVSAARTGAIDGASAAAGVLCLLLTVVTGIWLTRYEPPWTR
jgi:xanthine/uracil permease